MTKLLSIVGARPQFIKAGAVRRALERWNQSVPASRRLEDVLVHTGQHYDYNMSSVFFEELQIPEPNYNLGVGSDSHGRQTGLMIAAIENVLLQEEPDLVIVYGDTNSTLAGVLAAAKLHIPVAHVEAGLRSYNRKMAEEVNRVVADELSQILFCPTEAAVENLRREGIVDDGSGFQGARRDLFQIRRVVRVGDVMADSILFHQRTASQKSRVMERLALGKGPEHGRYVLLTIHRAENVDDASKLSLILDAVEKIAEKGFTVVFPVHPRTRKRLSKMKYSILNPSRHSLPSIRAVEPLAYLDMLQLEKHAFAILTDSGGVQKEAFLCKVPCITLRDETEWVETVTLGWNYLAGSEPQKILEAFELVLQWSKTLPPFPRDPSQQHKDTNPYGTGHASEEIVAIIADLLTPGN